MLTTKISDQHIARQRVLDGNVATSTGHHRTSIPRYRAFGQQWTRCLTGLIALTLAGCSSTSVLTPVHIHSTTQMAPGPVDANDKDGAPAAVSDIATLVDAQPRPVIRTLAGNTSPYTVSGKRYTVLKESRGYQEQGYASWYGTKFHGRPTANGDRYDMWGMTAAHRTLPIPSYVKVTNIANGKSVIVLVNDRGPFHDNRIIDLSYAAALKLGFAKEGVTEVHIEDITPTSPSKPPTTTPASQPSVTAHPARQAEYLQIAAFRHIANANKLQKQLRQLLTAPVNIVSTSDNTWHRVKVGPITSIQMMSETRQLLFEHGLHPDQ